MKRILYDLAAADETIRFSPYCWRAKLALAHKNLAFETIAWHFTDKDVIAFSGQGKVPVLVDGGKTIFDSQSIAEYLETAYPNEASLFGEPPARALTLFIKSWTEEVLNPAIVPIVLPDIFVRLAPKDQPYFRATREKFWGIKIEDFYLRRAEHIANFKATLAPLRTTLSAQAFIAGTAPNYADHIVFGALKWAQMMSADPLFEPDDRILAWMDEVLGTYGL